MPLRMLRDNVAIVPMADPSHHSILHVPDQAKQRPDQGIVLYRGPDCHTLRVGHHVVFSSYTGTKVVLPDEGTFIIMSERDVDLIVDEGKSVRFIPEPALLTLIFNNTDEPVRERLTTLIKSQPFVDLEF